MDLDSLLLQKEAERMADAHARHTTATFIVVIIVLIDFVDDWYNNHHSTDNYDNMDC